MNIKSANMLVVGKLGETVEQLEKYRNDLKDHERKTLPFRIALRAGTDDCQVDVFGAACLHGADANRASRVAAFGLEMHFR